MWRDDEQGGQKAGGFSISGTSARNGVGQMMIEIEFPPDSACGSPALKIPL